MSYCLLKANPVNLEELTIIYFYLLTNNSLVSIGKEERKEGEGALLIFKADLCSAHLHVCPVEREQHWYPGCSGK